MYGGGSLTTTGLTPDGMWNFENDLLFVYFVISKTCFTPRKVDKLSPQWVNSVQPPHG